MKNVFRGSFLKKNAAMLLDALFLALSVGSILLLAAMVFEFAFVIPAAVFCISWLALSLAVSKRQGAVIRLLVKRGKLMASCGLPCNRRLHTVYTGLLLVSFMAFFGFMVVMRELSMMLAFVSWLYIGYATLHDIGERETNQQKVQTDQSCVQSTAEKPRLPSRRQQSRPTTKAKEVVT